MKSGHGLIVNIILGIVGGFVGNFIFGLLKISFLGFFGNIISTVVGACLVIFVVRLIKK